MTNTITPELRARFEKIALNPLSDMTADQLIAASLYHYVDIAHYADLLDMQLDVASAILRYRDSRGDLSQADIMANASGILGTALTYLTREKPLPGADVTSAIVSDVCRSFAYFFGRYLNFSRPPAPAMPTHDAPNTLN